MRHYSGKHNTTNESKLFTSTTIWLSHRALFSTWLCRALFSACGAEAPPSLTSGGGLCRWRALDISAGRTERGHSQDPDQNWFFCQACKNVSEVCFYMTDKRELNTIPVIIPMEHKTQAGHRVKSLFQCCVPRLIFSPVWWSPVWCCALTLASRWRSVSSAASRCERSFPGPPEKWSLPLLDTKCGWHA